ncbi:hypothetical protein RDV84_03100 [Lysobacter yananisis]|uniref:Uncharacterized protein n=1 Tax=Lysobacter yananisis TaxID=1003114 RepID=A0ABY9P9Z2_9GAMM|nr:hypothetical protein [Lysobacter yananisis]WMT03846.1 hypothetical protein RDV84_03100 [Lysobacter yananisis]
MERSPISTSPRRRAKTRSFVLAALVAAFGLGEAAATVVLPRFPSEADYLACPGGQAWRDGTRARIDRADLLRRSLSPPRDPALREAVLRLSAQALQRPYLDGSNPGVEAAAAAADAAAAAADAAAAAADAAADSMADGKGAQPRRAPPSPPAEVQAAVRRLGDILRRQPMPGIAEIGEDGVQALWGAIERDRGDAARQERLAEAFLDTQRRSPGIDPFTLRNAMERVDVLRLADGRRQRYGTQFDYPERKVVQRPIESERAMDAYRAEFGMMPAALETCLRQRLENPYGFLPGFP